MGGGDLNLKKSWHPTTLRNMERVWKAEQKHEAEKKKIEELQKELAEERAREEIRHFAEEQGVVKKKAERLDWMYEGHSSMINKEDYLLGKCVDKTYELLQQAEAGTSKVDGDAVPESIFKSATGNVTIDLENKIREDPLLVIKKQEQENRKKLLDNPVRMKQLQMMLQEMNSKQKKGKERKRKKEKKSKKRNRRDTSDSESDESRSRESKLKKKDSNWVKGHKNENRRLRKARSSSLDSSSSSSGPRKTKVRHRSRSPLSARPPASWRRHRSRSGSANRRSSPAYRRKRTPERKRDSSNFRSPHESKRRPRMKRSRSRSPNRRPNMHQDDRAAEQNYTKSRKIDATEKQKRLEEMMENAKWREEQRSTNLKKHREEEKTEKLLQEKTANYDFVTPMLNRAVNLGSVEGRIKSNIYNIQRTKSELDKNFTKR